MEIKTLILKEIACGMPLNGCKELPDWPCGDFLEQEQDENGRWMGEYFFCKNCHEKAEKILEYFNELIEEMPVTGYIGEPAIILTYFKRKIQKKIKEVKNGK